MVLILCSHPLQLQVVVAVVVRRLEQMDKLAVLAVEQLVQVLLELELLVKVLQAEQVLVLEPLVVAVLVVLAQMLQAVQQGMVVRVFAPQ
jgi:hypothetical protein